jgi:DNA-binding response OmpR family regulator
MASYSKTAQKRHIDFQLLRGQEELLVWFDTSIMDKVLFNLLSNAFKFTPDGGKIDLVIFVDNFKNRVKLTVEDNGKGMSEDEMQHIFEAFYQGEERQFVGTGLGLSLSKTLVEMHGGTISVQSSKGKGSRFTVALPLGKEHLTAEQMVFEREQTVYTEGYLFNTETDDAEVMTVVENTSATQQILIIEDNEELQFFLRKKLSATYQIVSATDGNEAIQTAFDTVPDLIICDIMLPNKNGFDITKTLKSDLRTSHIPIILLTAQINMTQQIRGIEMGADAYLTKPFNIHFLEATIKSLLLNRQILKENNHKDVVAFADKTAHLNLPENTNALDRDFIAKFVIYIEKNYARQDFQVTDLCKEFGLSRSQLYRKVTALLGETMSDYIQNVRLKKAEELLLEGKLPVADIAYEVGYSSPDYFSTVFKSKYNVAPSQFRKKKGGPMTKYLTP